MWDQQQTRTNNNKQQQQTTTNNTQEQTTTTTTTTTTDKRAAGFGNCDWSGSCRGYPAWVFEEAMRACSEGIGAVVCVEPEAPVRDFQEGVFGRLFSCTMQPKYISLVLPLTYCLIKWRKWWINDECCSLQQCSNTVTMVGLKINASHLLRPLSAVIRHRLHIYASQSCNWISSMFPRASRGTCTLRVAWACASDTRRGQADEQTNRRKARCADGRTDARSEGRGEEVRSDGRFRLNGILDVMSLAFGYHGTRVAARKRLHGTPITVHEPLWSSFTIFTHWDWDCDSLRKIVLWGHWLIKSAMWLTIKSKIKTIIMWNVFFWRRIVFY